MPRQTVSGRRARCTPNKLINARMPPSPSLSTRITTNTYFTEVMITSVQINNESRPSTAAWVVDPASCNTVLRV